MWQSAGLALARLQMSRPKRNGPPEKPNPLDANLSALWDFLTHLNKRIDSLYTLMITGFLAVVGLFAAVLTAVVMK